MIFTGFVAGVTADALRCRYVKDKRDSELGSAFVTPLLKSSASKNDPSQAVRSKLEEPTIVKETERAFGKNESFEDSDSTDLGKESKSFLANLLPESGSQSRDKEKEDKTSEKESEEPMSKEVENQDDSRGWLSGLLGSSEEADKESGPEDKFIASEKEPSGLRVPFKDEAEATMEGAKTWFSDLNTKVHEKIEELQPSEEKHDQDDQNSESSGWFSSLLGTSNKSCCNEAEELKSCIERCLESPRTDEREKKASTEEEEDSRTGWFSGSKSDTSGYEPDEESDQSGWFSGRSNQADTKEKQQHLDEEEPDKESYSSGWFSGWFGSTRPAERATEESGQEDKSIDSEKEKQQHLDQEEPDKESYSSGWFSGWFGSTRPAERDTEESGQEDESIDSEKEPSGLREEAEATLEGAKAWFSDLNSKVHEKIDEHLPDTQSDKVKADENNSSWWFSSSSPEKSSQLFCGKTEDPREESKSTEAEVRGLLPSIFSGSSTQTDEESQEPKEPVKEKGGSWWPFSSRSQEDVVKDNDDDRICCEMATLKSCKKEDIKIRVCGILSVEEIIRK